MDKNIEILDEEIIYENKSFRKLKRWIKGIHPELGIIVRGYTGFETLIEKEVIIPMKKYEVIEEVPPIHDKLTKIET